MTNFIDAALRDPKQLGALGTYKAFAQSRGILEADPQLAQMYEQYSQTTLAALHSGGGFGGNYLKGPIHEAIPSIDKTILYNMYGLQAQADHWINTLSAQRAGLTSRHQLEALDDEIQMWKDVKSKYNVTLESGVSGQRGPSKGMAMPTKEYITFQGNVINKDFQVLLRKDKSYENAGHEKLTGAQLLSIARRKQLEPMYFYRNWITQ
jgi:hypothetical protein